MTSLRVALLLLAAVGTASAECAWVLWSTVEHVNVRPGKVSGHDWAPEGALPSYSGCIEAARERAERLGKVGYKSNVEHAAFYPIMGGYRADWTYKNVEGHLSHAEFRCLPDTIDPRGPKTK